MSSDVNISVKVAVQEANRNLNTLSQNLKASTQSTDRLAEATKSAGGAFKVFQGVIAANVVAAGFRAIQNAASGLFRTFVTDGIAAAQRQEDAINALNIALKATGQFTESTSEELQNFASELQNASKFGDELILENAALIQSLGGLEKDGLKAATQAAVDMSAALGIDLTAAATLVGKAAAGEVGSFSRYGLSIKKGADDAETFANALDALNSKFGGAAAGQVNTFSGAYAQLSNDFGDLTEEIGFLITKNETLIGAFQTIRGIIATVSNEIKTNIDFYKELAVSVGIAVGAVTAVGVAVGLATIGFSGLAAAASAAWIAVTGPIGLTVAAIASLSAAIFVVRQNWDQVTMSIKNAIATTLEYTAIGVAAFSSEKAAALRATAKAYREEAEAIKASIATKQQDIEAAKIKTEEDKKAKNALQEKANAEIAAQKAADARAAKQAEIEKKRLEEQVKAQKAAADKLAQSRQKLALVEEQERILNLQADSVFQDDKLKQLEGFFTKQKAAEIQAGINLAETETEKQRLITEAMTLGIQNRLNAQKEVGEAEITAFIETQQDRLEYIREVLGDEEFLREQARARELAARGDFIAAENSLEAARVKARRNDIFAMQRFEELSQRERIGNLKSTMGTIATLQQSGSRRLFEVGKAAAIGQATIDGFAAVQKALASAPPPLNFALAGVVGVATAANISNIASQQPRFQNGGIVPGQSMSGDRVQARVNSGEMILNRQQQANLFRMANSGGGGGSQEIVVPVTVEVDGEVIGRVVSRQVANGLQLGEVQ